jgi:endoglycosylceramidase
VPIIDRFDHQYSFSAEDVAYLRQWGANAIRLAVMWPGVEPTRGQYNTTYMAMMKNITAMCEAAGIAVLLEMHQDVFSEKFCGEGVPLWAAVPTNSSAAFPEPLKPPYQVDVRAQRRSTRFTPVSGNSAA